MNDIVSIWFASFMRYLRPLWQRLKTFFNPTTATPSINSRPAACLLENGVATGHKFYGEFATPLHQDTVLTFQLTPSTHQIDGLCVRFGTYQRRNHCHVVIQTGQLQQKINVADVLDNEYENIKFPQPVACVAGQAVILQLSSPDADANNTIGVWCHPLLPTFQPLKPQPLHFANTQSPRVSIVIPVYNKAVYTYNCLLRLLHCDASIAQEIIIINNASSDATADLLENLSGAVTVIHNEENQGFVGACNQGAALARGEFIVFLNNDTQVLDNWLSSMVTLMDNNARIGITGSKLIYPDGRLQEAGGIIFNDASGWNYGRLQDPSDPEFQQNRAVDYCSGASLMIRRDLWQQLGGFDSRYAPAYYEDTDLCFAAQAAGFDVVYCHESVVVHHEGITAGTDTQSGYKAYQTLNQQKFFDKWQTKLSQHHPPSHQPQAAAWRLQTQSTN